MPFTVGRPDAHELAGIARLIAHEQADPTRRIPYLSDRADAIAAEITAEPDWIERTWVLRRAGIEGCVVIETDDDLDRVWWTGPFVVGDDWQVGADALYVAARPTVPHIQEELAGDHRHAELAGFAARYGFVPQEASVALRCAVPPPPGQWSCSAVSPAERAVVARMHDAVFPGTHSTGARLVGRDDPDLMCLVAHVDDEVAGYVAVEMQADGSGYIDFVGVDPRHRGSGLGRSLLAAATRALFDRGATHVHLTVRAGNEVARRLYADLGFVEDFILQPYRKGFSLD